MLPSYVAFLTNTYYFSVFLVLEVHSLFHYFLEGMNDVCMLRHVRTQDQIRQVLEREHGSLSICDINFCYGKQAGILPL